MDNKPSLEENEILKAEIAKYRVQGWSLHKLAIKYGYSKKELGEVLEKWLREALANGEDVNSQIVDLAMSRYEALIEKMWPILMDMETNEIKKSKGAFAVLTKLLMEVMSAQLKVAGVADGNKNSSSVDSEEEENIPISDLEEEAIRLKINL